MLRGLYVVLGLSDGYKASKCFISCTISMTLLTPDFCFILCFGAHLVVLGFYSWLSVQGLLLTGLRSICNVRDYIRVS